MHDTRQPDLAAQQRAAPDVRRGEHAFADRRASTARLTQLAAMVDGSPRMAAQAANRTGLPDRVKGGIEALSGVALDDVRVHANSAQPARLGALAYAQGTDIHLAPGQERHLPHEAWHVVQQKQGRVRPTQHAGGAAINDDPALEAEAERMGAHALAHPAGAAPDALAQVRPHKEGVMQGVVQGVFDWAQNKLNNRRKAGVEITESNAGGNGLVGLVPTAAWAGLAGPAKDALWTDTVVLRNAAGGAQQWVVGTSAALLPLYFADDAGKHVVMQWGSVQMTEDYREFEWIIRHPPAVVGITHYRDQLAAVATARAAVRDALAGTGLGGPYVIARNRDPAQGEVYEINPQGTDAASSQITFESTDRNVTKTALMEGLTHGLDKRNVPNRTSLVAADNDVVGAVTTAAGRVALAGVDMELVMAYLIGDVCHKIAVLIDGAGWNVAVAANFKQWRTLFPKSHPSQIMFQAMDPPHTAPKIAALRTAINAQAAAIAGDITELFARKLGTMRVEWSPDDFTNASDPLGILLAGTAPNAPLPVGGIGALQTALVTFATQNGVAPAAELANAVAALTDATATVNNVVRSTGFATHAPNTTGFAFEDRAEVATDFPELATTYARIKAVLNRY